MPHHLITIVPCLRGIISSNLFICLCTQKWMFYLAPRTQRRTFPQWSINQERERERARERTINLILPLPYPVFSLLNETLSPSVRWRMSRIVGVTLCYCFLTEAPPARPTWSLLNVLYRSLFERLFLSLFLSLSRSLITNITNEKYARNQHSERKACHDRSTI